MVKIVENKQLIEDVFNYDVVLYGMGINNAMNKGFSYDIALNFPVVYEEENKTGYGDLRKYGNIRITNINPIFCACYCYNLGMIRKNNGRFIDYELLNKCLEIVKHNFKGKRIVSPIIGQDKYDGNGDKEIILDLYNRAFCDDTDIILYDFEQHDFKELIYKERLNISSMFKEGKITRSEMKEKQRQCEWKRLHGIFEKVPDDYVYNPKLWTKERISVKKST